MGLRRSRRLACPFRIEKPSTWRLHPPRSESVLERSGFSPHTFLKSAQGLGQESRPDSVRPHVPARVPHEWLARRHCPNGTRSRSPPPRMKYTKRTTFSRLSPRPP